MDAPKSHARSNSLPSKSHPIVANVEDNLGQLRGFETTSSSSSSSSSLSLFRNLAALKDMYECADNLLQLRATKRAFLNERRHDKFVDDMLDGSLMLLDICSSLKDALSQIKCCVRDLKSSLRRRIRCESSLMNEIKKYFVSRKQVNKIVRNCFSNVKVMERSKASLADSDDDFVALASKLNKVEAVSITVFKSLLSFLYSPKSNPTGRSLVSKFIRNKRVYFEVEGNEDDIDDCLEAFIKNKSGKSMDVIQVQKALKNLEAFESTIQELEEGLECAFRCLIKTRVSLLNIVNH